MAEKVQPKNLEQKLNAVMKKVRYAQKESKNEHLKYKFVSHDAVVGLIRGELVEEGVNIHSTAEWIFENNLYMCKLFVVMKNIDNPEDKIELKFSFPIATRTSPDEKQFGAAYSYGLKYALLKNFMIETGDDADEMPAAPLPVLSQEQIKSITLLLNDDEERKQKLLKFFKVEALEQIEAKHYDTIMQNLTKKPTKPAQKAA